MLCSCGSVRYCHFWLTGVPWGPTFHSFVNSVILLALFAPSLILNLWAEPVKRGFFCNDENLSHPLRANTVRVSWLILGSILLPVICILIVEAKLTVEQRSGKLIRKIGNTFVAYMFGFTVVLLITDVAKYTVGRLRPNFFAMCGIDFSELDCGTLMHPKFVLNYTCVGNTTLTPTAWAAKNAHMSFVSGHASMSSGAATFVILYLHGKLGNKLNSGGNGDPKFYLLLPTIQLIVACIAFFVGLSRISDYWHHPSDVLAGSFIGMFVQYCNIFYVIKLFPREMSLLLAPSVEGTSSNTDDASVIHSTVSSTSSALRERLTQPNEITQQT